MRQELFGLKFLIAFIKFPPCEFDCAAVVLIILCVLLQGAHTFKECLQVCSFSRQNRYICCLHYFPKLIDIFLYKLRL